MELMTRVKWPEAPQAVGIQHTRKNVVRSWVAVKTIPGSKWQQLIWLLLSVDLDESTNLL